jgi:hypothetical protein
LGVLEDLMASLNASERQVLALLKARLARVERGAAWSAEEFGPHTATERMEEINRIKDRISEIEKGHDA